METAIDIRLYRREDLPQIDAFEARVQPKPALQLYQKLGFHEVGISFIDRYELAWLELRL